ncbi:hypothetical protein K5549_009700 [Capra hircus]|nr:hypothetical protein K5549_009700 [Capra hircus]
MFCESRLFCTNFKDSVIMTQLINHHLREETRGKVVNLVSKLNANSMMMLVNYMYFNGQCVALWEKPFIPFLTAPHNFCVDEDTTVKVPTMLQDTQHHWYLHDRLDQILPKLGITDLFLQRADLSGIT